MQLCIKYSNNAFICFCFLLTFFTCFFLLKLFLPCCVFFFVSLQQISGNCNTTILHTPEKYSYLYSYDCTLVPGKTSNGFFFLPQCSIFFWSTLRLKHRYGLKTHDCKGWRRPVISLPCSGNQFDLIWSLWHGVLSCLKQPWVNRSTVVIETWMWSATTLREGSGA